MPEPLSRDTLLSRAELKAFMAEFPNGLNPESRTARLIATIEAMVNIISCDKCGGRGRLGTLIIVQDQNWVNCSECQEDREALKGWP